MIDDSSKPRLERVEEAWQLCASSADDPSSLAVLHTVLTALVRNQRTDPIDPGETVDAVMLMRFLIPILGTRRALASLAEPIPVTLQDPDRSRIEELVFDPRARGSTSFFDDEIPERISASGWQFLCDLSNYRILVSEGRGDTFAAFPYRTAWEYGRSIDLKWPGYERPISPPWNEKSPA